MEVLIICKPMAFRCPGIIGSVFRRQFTNPTHEKITCNFSKKYHLGSDSILLSWILSILHRDYSYCRWDEIGFAIWTKVNGKP
jgi:hypothetical protein